MFQITLDAAAADARLAAMINKLQKLPLADELTAWQREDMKRRFPEIQDVTPTSATTLIHTHTRGRGSARGRANRRQRSQGKKAPRPIIRSKRPILRPELFDRLCARMVAMLTRELKW